MSFTLRKPNGTGEIRYSPIFSAPGARGFFKEGYPWHRYWKLLGMTWQSTSFVAKTATTNPTPGNMPLKADGLTPKEFKPKCIEVYPQTGHVLNAVGLSNIGFRPLLATRRWQELPEPFMLSFMPQGKDAEAKLLDCETFVREFLTQYYEGPLGHFRSDFAMQVNCACPNTKTDTACLLSEAESMLRAFQPIREAGIPVVANFNPLVPVVTAQKVEPLCDALWIANTVPWGQAADRIDWKKFVRSVTRTDPNGFMKETVPVENGLPASPLTLRGMPAAGGLSGPDCFPITLEKVAGLRKAGIAVPIVAGNGIQNAEDVASLAKAGASAVAVGSVALVRPWRMRGIIVAAHRHFWRLRFFNQRKGIPMEPTFTEITIPTPFDAHIHLRDGDALATTVPHAAARFGAAIVMPNLKPPVTTVEQAAEYRRRILEHVPKETAFEPYMTLYLTDSTTPNEIERAATNEIGLVAGVKLYPANATTNSAAGVTDVSKCFRVFEAMEKLGLPLCVHAEVTDPSVDVFDREEVFIDQILSGIVGRFPDLRVVLEHATTKEGIDFVLESGPKVAASITAHHLLFDRNELFKGGIRPHYYCLPILKRGIHREALLRAAVSGNPKFFAGTDSAPHARHTKETSCGCAGCYTAPYGPEAYAKAFEEAGAFGDLLSGTIENSAVIARAVESFSAFLSESGPAFYGIPTLPGSVKLSRKAWSVPGEYAYGDGQALVPLLANERLEWIAERV